MDGPSYKRPCVQIAVADNGIGILESMRFLHQELTDPKVALEKSLRAYISGAFEEGLSGKGDNAGMGLFYISEIAKLTAGRMLLASKGAALLIQGEQNGKGNARFLTPDGTGYPGTLVAFELPIGGTQDYKGLLDLIAKKAEELAPKRIVQKWIEYSERIPEDCVRILVNSIPKESESARNYSNKNIIPKILERQSICLDFRNIDIMTQRDLHAILHESLRVAWALKVKIHVIEASPSVIEGLKAVERASLGG